MATSIDIDAPNPPWTDALLDLKRGKQVILERNGVPVAQLAEAAPEPTVRAPDRGYGMDAGKIWFAPDFDETPDWLVSAFEGEEASLSK